MDGWALLLSGLNMALPFDNMFYGWPAKGKPSVSTLQEIGVYSKPYDIYASAHSIYSPTYQSTSSLSFSALCAR